MQQPQLIFFVIFFIIISLGNSQSIDCKPGRGGSKVANTIVVDQSGKGQFNKIQDAIDSIPKNNNQWIKIRINPGTYKEQVTIPYDKPCIFLEGKDRKLTTITYNAHEDTDMSATFTSSPSNIVAKDITFKNSYNLPFNQKFYNKNIYYGIKIPGVIPALSARIYGDKSAFYDCAFVGVQDTLWDVQGRHHFSNCYIEGAVDFIFGAGQSFYEGCSINVTSAGFITAQGREFPNETNGFIFSRCTISGIRGVRALLGRAFRPYSKVIFQESFLSEVVDPLGWNAWHYAGHEDKFTYAEINCKGPGSNKSKRVPWEKKLSANQLKEFSKSSFIDQDGWLAKLPL